MGGWDRWDLVTLHEYSEFLYHLTKLWIIFIYRFFSLYFVNILTFLSVLPRLFTNRMSSICFQYSPLIITLYCCFYRFQESLVPQLYAPKLAVLTMNKYLS